MDDSRRQFLKIGLHGALAGAWPIGSPIAAAAGSRGDSQVGAVRHLGEQFLANDMGITGCDGATSTLLPSGEALWVFGDTVEGEFESIHEVDLARIRSNTAALVPPQDASRGIGRFRFLAEPDGKRPRQIVPFAADEDPARHRIWAIHGACVGQQIYLYYHRITLLPGVDVFANFELDGMGIARGRIGEYRFARLVAPDGTHEFWKGDEPGFGVFIEPRDGWLYLWGCLKTGMYLARTRPGALEDLSQYEYLVAAPTPQQPDAKPRWSRTFEPSGVLIDSVPNEMSAAYNRHLRKHVAFHSLHREHKIVMRTAPRITGPWSAGEVIYRPEQITENDLIYAVKEHPELAREGGRILYVTFVNSATYVPQMIEVTLT